MVIKRIWFIASLACGGVVSGCVSSSHVEVVEVDGSHDSKARSSAAVAPPAIYRGTNIGAYRYTRQVSMFYRLDLAKDNALAPAVAASMRPYEASVRNCYTSRLEANPRLAGEVALSFSLGKATGNQMQVAHVGGTLNDLGLVACVKQRLAEIPFRPPYDLHGMLRYQFNVTDRATAAR